MNRVEILGVEISNLTFNELPAELDKLLDSGTAKQIVTPNPEFCVRATHDFEFKTILNKAALSLPDGAGLKLAGWYLGTPIKQRVTGVSLVEELCRLAAERGLKVFFLGAKKHIAHQTAEKFVKRFPGLRVAGAENEYTFLGRRRSDQEIVERINSRNAEILLVAFGSPFQEKWIYRSLPKFMTVKIAVGVGGTFDYFSGKIKRAPNWLQAIGLEWLFRLIRQPWRLPRIINATLVFMIKVIRSKGKKL